MKNKFHKKIVNLILKAEGSNDSKYLRWKRFNAEYDFDTFFKRISYDPTIITLIPHGNVVSEINLAIDAMLHHDPICTVPYSLDEIASINLQKQFHTKEHLEEFRKNMLTEHRAYFNQEVTMEWFICWLLGLTNDEDDSNDPKNFEK